MELSAVLKIAYNNKKSSKIKYLPHLQRPNLTLFLVKGYQLQVRSSILALSSILSKRVVLGIVIMVLKLVKVVKVQKNSSKIKKVFKLELSKTMHGFLSNETF